MATAAMATPGGSAPGAEAPQQAQGQPDNKAAIEQFRQLAAMVQQLASKFPEFTPSASQIIPLIQKGMVAVAGNAQRTPDRQSPPVGP